MITEIKLIYSLVSILKCHLDGIFIMTEKDCFFFTEVAMCILQENTIVDGSKQFTSAVTKLFLKYYFKNKMYLENMSLIFRYKGKSVKEI